MTYFVIDNFGRGLDVRKHIFNLPPGCLFRGKNVNINRGGEPESAKAFVAKYNLPPNTFGLMAAGGKLWTFGTNDWNATGSIPAGVNYLQYDNPGGMTGFVNGTSIKGKPFTMTTFTDGYGVFFNGTRVTDFSPALPPAGGSYADVAANFAAQINTNPYYSAGAGGAVVTITGRPGVNFSIAATATNGGAVNDQTASVAVTQNAVAGGTTETRASGTITFSGVTPTWNEDLGQWVATQFINGLTINGVEQLNRSLVAMDDEGAASAVATYCNAYSAAPDYDAVASGSSVTFTARAGAGSVPNGYVIAPASGNAGTAVMAGGAGPTAAVPKICTVTFGGTYEAADNYSITLDGVPYTIVGGVSSTNPTSGQRPIAALTKQGKTYAIAGPNLFGSVIGDCTQWHDGSGKVGSFITDMSSELSGADSMTAMAIFQGNLALFSRNTIQIEFVDPDPANNEQVQALQNIGTMAAKSVLSFGDSDVFFLSDTGVRSLKVRAATDSATLADIGSPIDPLVIAAIKASMSNAMASCSAIEPIDGRFMLQIGTTTFVFSFFPDAKVAAWTTYETGLAFTDFAVIGTRLYARAGDTIYLLGGDNNDQYSAQPPDIKIPFISARQIATLKHFTALDVTCDGVFDVSISTDPLAPDTEEVVATVNGTTYGLGSSKIAGEDVTAISLRFVGRPSKYARLSNIAVHHEVIKENAP